ncbi:MAG TPA: phage antirepressor KilAC domain-containing protein [Sediminibacterium sp.]|uniref:phage antirepressor KilAC domain-containing protein n=1 Tax=Sediminibacterium sp. TaxID=1917865 RepID=UPI0008BE4F76|nr:phage antirepressor KilAC domain-containing protein [Sediminibacterium sp.]OHC85629.1 MAG: hypothetical protein A2472_07705 [Sphingobacteriia bacterium RIFOXYC2_FULL_35_18]OHC89292.1 MAG: hypothetical protein A2546_07130 [Sphingobacteriia bacterium RIFOXYD2_FULL_35_12]HLD52731.1 phage antirepressor KilAC domain-containing protein [Sediminibacterium sp.]
MSLLKNNTVPFSGTEGYLGMRNAAVVLNRNIGRKRLLRFLRRNKFLDKRNQPYPEFIEIGYFTRVIKVTYGNRGRLQRHHRVPLISESCIEAIRNQVRKDFDVKGKDICVEVPICIDEATKEYFRKIYPIKTATPSIQAKSPCHVKK